MREHGEDLLPVVSGNAPSANTDLASIFEKTGLRPERRSFLMVADLKDGRVPWPRGCRRATRCTRGTDSTTTTFVGPTTAPSSGTRLHTAECGDVGAVADNRAFRPWLSLLAPDSADNIAAYIQTNEFEAVVAATGIGEAYVAKVGTSVQHRRKGLAGVLLRIALQRYRDEGFDRAALDVDSENPTGALGFHERAGFRNDMRWTSYRLEG